ncbi:toll-like receptor e [Plakobranchus ocellatus]|uniref:Toll-like receptor e n=1 Tax=Plakobranchus ocellatus TaxID=259542 RepID=A0AAV3XTV2_9GAST|nr:toll-like receptor e [Plakobranchus ocellatus]
MDNEIEVIEKGALLNLPNTLKFLNLTNNKIVFGEYIQDLGNLKGLHTLIVGGSYIPYNFSLFYPSGGLKYCGMRKGTISETVDQEELATHRIDEYIKSISVPPYLSRLSMAYNGMVYTLNNITFAENNLTSADVRGNVFTNLVGPIRGLHKLKFLTLDDCHIHHVSDTFFDYFPELEQLSFFQNFLGYTLLEDVHGNLFQSLKNLISLDLSTNGIIILNRPVFKNMNNLKNLLLSGNRLGLVNFTIAHLKQLETLDLKNNEIRTLGPHTWAEINQINKGRAPLKLDLSYNPIGCDCNNFEFLQWLTESPELMNSSKYRYYCELQHQTDNYKAVIEKLRKQCISHEGLFAIVTCTTVILMLVILFALAYRFR